MKKYKNYKEKYQQKTKEVKDKEHTANLCRSKLTKYEGLIQRHEMELEKALSAYDAEIYHLQVNSEHMNTHEY